MVDPLSTAANAATVADRLAALANWLRRWLGRAQESPGHKRKPPPSLAEAVPVHVSIVLSRNPPMVEVHLRVVNYASKPLRLKELYVMRLNVSGSFALDRIPLARQLTIAPRQSADVYCERALADSEVRGVIGLGSAISGQGVLSFQGEGRVGKSEVRLGPEVGRVVRVSVSGAAA